jgi:hypothetical protein
MVETTERLTAFEQRFAAYADSSGFAPRTSTITPGRSAIGKAATRVGLNLRPIYAPCEPCGAACAAQYLPQISAKHAPGGVSHRSQNIETELKRNVSSRLTGA